jgi:hypothetical protein
VTLAAGRGTRRRKDRSVFAAGSIFFTENYGNPANYSIFVAKFVAYVYAF